VGAFDRRRAWVYSTFMAFVLIPGYASRICGIADGLQHTWLACHGMSRGNQISLFPDVIQCFEVSGVVVYTEGDLLRSK
jgi:hypothetical protein